MRYRLRTLLIATTIGPPLLAVAWWLNLVPIVSAVLIYAIVVALVDRQKCCPRSFSGPPLDFFNDID